MKTYEVEVLAVVAVKYEITATTVKDAMKEAEGSVGEDLEKMLQFMATPGAKYTGESAGFIVNDDKYFDHNMEEKGNSLGY